MDRFLDMHMYITSALQKTDMKAVGLQLALDLLYEKVTVIIYHRVLPKRYAKYCLLMRLRKNEI